MGYPAFIAEMGRPDRRDRLRAGVVSGYVLLALFAVLLGVADATGLLSVRWWLWGLVAFKLATNTVALLTLRYDRWVLEGAALNVVADLLAMTGAIYWTGGEHSPLTGIYLIEVTVHALLSNAGITVLLASLALLLYAAMAVLTFFGILPQPPTILGAPAAITGTYLALDLAWQALLLGAATGFTSVVVQRLRQREQALEKRTAELVDAERLKGQFMANISHELRTPVHGILGLTELLRSGVYGALSDRQRTALGTIEQNARDLLGRVEDLLQMSLADAGKLRFRAEPLPVAHTVRQVLAASRWMLERKNISLRAEVSEDLGVVHTDRAKLNQVLVEMLANAVKFTPEGGWVVLRGFWDPEGWLCLSVSDSGKGIPVTEQAVIFEDFRQGDGSSTRSEGGMGIGLGVVRRLLDLMGGRLQLESSVGVGSTFTIKIPREPPEGGEPSAPPESTAPDGAGEAPPDASP